MATNKQPMFTGSPDVQGIGAIVTANTTGDLTSGTSYLAFTADGTNGGFVHRLRFRPTPGNNTTATACRVWLNNGSTTGTATNNFLFDEVTLPLITVSSVASVQGFEVPMNVAIPAGWKIYVTVATGQGSASWSVITIGGKY